jgi:hypothetical protein
LVGGITPFFTKRAAPVERILVAVSRLEFTPFYGELFMATSAEAQMLAEHGQRVNAIGAQCGEHASRATAGFPHSCDTPRARQIYAQLEELSSLLRQCAERANELGAGAMH